MSPHYEKEDPTSGEGVDSPSNFSSIPDFTVLNEGDPFKKKIIAKLIFQSETCIVYLDQNLKVCWMTNSEYGHYAQDFGAVRARADLLKSIPRELLADTQFEALQRQVGAAMAGLLDDKISDNANSILDKAETYLRTRTTERARRWFLSAAFCVTGGALLVATLLMLFRGTIQPRIGLNGFEIALATLMGSLGAVLSMVLRMTKLDIDAMAGSGVHYFEGAVRSLAGMAGAFLVALCVKADVVLGVINDTSNTLPFLLALGVVAGASERLVPNLIKKVEGTLIVDKS
jgi:hypothetical protein